MTNGADTEDVFSQARGGWASLVVAVLTGAVCLFMAAAGGLLVASGETAIGAFIAAIAAVMAILCRYTARDAHGKLGWRIAVAGDGLTLDLPAGRSLIHRLAPVHTRLRFDEIDCVETRLEAYRSFALANMHRSYALKLKSGEIVIFGEDRALGTGLQSAQFERVAARIVERGGLALRDLGMAEGKGGVLAVLFTAPPRWDAPRLDPETQAALWSRAGLTGKIALIGSLIVLLAALLNLIF